MDRRDLARLGHHVASRRVALGFRNRTDLAESLPFTVRTLADIEQGVRKANPGTYAMLENKLAWAPGSIDTILAGREHNDTVVELRHTTHNPLAHAPTEAPSRASTEELAAGATPPHHRPPRTDATTPGTTGTALTRTATGPSRGHERSHH